MQRRFLAILAVGLLPAAIAAPTRAAPRGTAPSAEAESREALRALVTASAAQPAAAAAPDPKQTVAPARLLPPPCSRKVKVVYSGYGEADRAACPTVQRPAG